MVLEDPTQDQLPHCFDSLARVLHHGRRQEGSSHIYEARIKGKQDEIRVPWLSLRAIAQGVNEEVLPLQVQPSPDSGPSLYYISFQGAFNMK